MPLTDAAVERNLELLSKKTDRIIAEEYRRAREVVKDHMAKLYEKHGVDGVLTYAEMAKYNRLNSLYDFLTKEITASGLSVTTYIKTLTKDSFSAAYYQYGEALQVSYGSDINFGQIPTGAVRSIVSDPNVSGQSLVDTLGKLRYDQLIRERASITQGIIQGESYPKMAKRIQKDFGKNFNDALRIARTEAHRSASEGQALAYDKAEARGVPLVRIWHAAGDGRTRDTHSQLNGDFADEEGFFYSSGAKTRYPGGFGVAGEDINCRCRVRARVRSELEREQKNT
jgi:SPP1 gp7 family putative phage head morphogenesis protein